MLRADEPQGMLPVAEPEAETKVKADGAVPAPAGLEAEPVCARSDDSIVHGIQCAGSDPATAARGQHVQAGNLDVGAGEAQRFDADRADAVAIEQQPVHAPKPVGSGIAEAIAGFHETPFPLPPVGSAGVVEVHLVMEMAFDERRELPRQPAADIDVVVGQWLDHAPPDEELVRFENVFVSVVRNHRRQSSNGEQPRQRQTESGKHVRAVERVLNAQDSDVRT